MLSDPLVAFVPVHAPVAVQDVALVEDQVKVVAVLYGILVLAAENVRVGKVELPTVTVTDCGAVVPPGPVQVRVYVLLAVKLPVV